jgi:hypothetical protein
MSRYAVIDGAKVVNTVVAEPDYASVQGWVACPDGVCIGWGYVNSQFVDNRPVPEALVTTAPTKEELLAQLQALQAQIEALG